MKKLFVALMLCASSAAAICGVGSAERIFADGFEDGSERCWTGPLTCLNCDGEQAPLCSDSEPLSWWLDRCEEGWPCYKECELEGTEDACLLLQIDYLFGEPQ